MIKNHLIILFPLVDWDAPWQRYQHFATVFSKHNRVIYFEPVHSIKYFLKKPSLLCKKLVGILKLKKEMVENLSVYRSPPVLPFGSRSHIVNCINQFFILLLVKFLTRDFKEKKNLCLWISDAAHWPLIKWLKPKVSVYDCTDAIIFRNPREQAYHDALRHRTIRDSSVSFFTSQLFFKEAKKYSNNCHYIPNGVDIENFRKKHYRVPLELKNAKRPILGFVGTLDSRMDKQVLNEILINRPNVSLVFVGPIVDDFREFRNESRVLLLGKRDYTEIPDFINQFDVALIPYRLYENTKFMYPVKLHEYLILGKPVVCTNLPELRQFSDIIYVAKDGSEFVEKIDKALRGKDEDRRKKRIETALANTWDKRLEQIESELEKVTKGCSEIGFQG